MIGIGVDIETIDRFKKNDVLHSQSLLNKIYTKKELKYSFSKKNPAQHLAVRYVAKEAVFKACSSLGILITNYKKIEIFNTRKGVPFARIHDSNINLLNIIISLSHCSDKAIAFALVILNNK